MNRSPSAPAARTAASWTRLLSLGLAMLATGRPGWTSDAEQAGMPRLAVRVNSLRSAAGVVRCSLYDGPDGFPQNTQRVIARSVASVRGGVAVCAFDGVEPGRDYAVVIHHDENADNVFQRNFVGLPMEGYGFSNNVWPLLAAPSFAACRFHFGGGAQSVGVTARY